VVQVNGRDYVTFRNIAEFYALKDFKRTGNQEVASSGLRSLRATKDSAEFFINNLKFILSYPATEQSGALCVSRMDLVKLIEPVMRPSRIRNAAVIDTVVLDAGHGAHDSGAVGYFGLEKNFTLDVVRRAKKLLTAAGYKVVTTRADDTFLTLDERVAIANKYPTGVFVSMHFNAGGWGTGVETYTLAPRGVPSMASDGPAVTDFVECPGNQNDAMNIALATAAHAAMVVKTRMFDRGIKRARFVVIRDTKIPAVLLEGGFVTNPYDGRFIATEDYREKLAGAILQAVQNYRKAVGSQSASPVAQARPPEPKDGPRVVTDSPDDGTPSSRPESAPKATNPSSSSGSGSGDSTTSDGKSPKSSPSNSAKSGPSKSSSPSPSSSKSSSKRKK
jgi:N-acetylmuramoyl-L-alanine amidase